MVFIPKKRQKLIYGHLRTFLGEVFHDLAARKGCKIEEGHLMKDHMHMCLSVPPKYAVSNVMGYLKGKSAITITRRFKGKQRNFNGEHFWAMLVAHNMSGFVARDLSGFIHSFILRVCDEAGRVATGTKTHAI